MPFNFNFRTIVSSRDIKTMIDFISKQDDKNFIPIIVLSNMFKKFIQGDEDEIKWINSRWVGRCLKRLSLVSEKRRVSSGVEVLLNTKKAEEKLKLFR